jgi:alpha-L-fucosidase
MRVLLFLLLLAVCLSVKGNPATLIKPPEPFGAVPNDNQIKWHQMEFYGFLHFTVNTFTGKEWGYGDESPALFNPTKTDANQWAKTATEAGMKGLIITAKHHDGFCLWQTELTEHSVKNTPWKNGKGDVLKELSRACKKHNLKMGVYLSPWDRNSAQYGNPEYVEYYREQLKEILTNYGEMFEVWHDGANGGDGFYGGARTERRIDKKTYYDWENTWNLIRKLQPGAVIFSDAGPDIRWVGNEEGYAPETCWAPINPEGFYPGIADQAILGTGTPGGEVWRPAEVDVSIRDGWFFHEDQNPKSIDRLLEIYYDSVGNGANLLLNMTPDKRGLIPDEDVARLKEFGKIIKQTFSHDLAKKRSVSATNTRGDSGSFAAARITDGDRDTYWATDDDVRMAQITIDLGKTTEFNRIRIEEYIRLGQRISAFSIEVKNDKGWEKISEGTTIGVRRILRFPTVKADQIRLNIEDSLACLTLSTFEIYNAER